MSAKRLGIVAASAVIAMLVVALVPVAEELDALANIQSDGKGYSFDNRDGGYIQFVISNPDNTTYTINVNVYERNSVVGSAENINLPAKRDTTVRIDMSDFRSVGEHTLVVKCTNATGGSQVLSNPEFTIQVDVEKNIFTNPVTYVVIAVIVIVIAILVYMKFRDAPKKENVMTFEELEEQRKMNMADKGQRKTKKETAAPKSERQRYLENKKK